MIKRSTRPNGSLRLQIINDEPSKTQQQFKDETDANLIVQKYNKNLHLQKFNADPSMYQDLTTHKNFFEANQTIARANQAFDALPSTIRTRFENNPEKFLEFLHDASNHDEAVRLGIFKPLPPSQIPPNSPASLNDSNEIIPPSKKSKTKPSNENPSSNSES